MSIVGRIFWTLLIWIYPLMCLEDYLSGNEVDFIGNWHEYTDTFKSRFPKEP
jgi:hypothetical protein